MQMQEILHCELSALLTDASQISLRLSGIAFADGRKRAHPPCGDTTFATALGLAVTLLDLPGPLPSMKDLRVPSIPVPWLIARNVCYCRHSGSCHISCFQPQSLLRRGIYPSPPSFRRALIAKIWSLQVTHCLDKERFRTIKLKASVVVGLMVGYERLKVEGKIASR